MSDILIAGVLQFVGFLGLLWLILGLVAGAEVRHERDQMSREWIEGRRKDGAR